MHIPPRVEVLVAGGGPAGAMAASLLAREGISVVLCERDHFPRYHIGESLLVSVLPFLEFIDVLAAVDAFGFKRKYGGFFKLLPDQPPGFVDFAKSHEHDYSYQVKRSEFDHLLLRHAAACGAQVFEGTSITEVMFDGPRPVAASWRRDSGAAGRIEFDHLIDATGLAGMLATKYLRNRKSQPLFDNLALGSYWTGHQDYVDPRGLAHLGDFFMESLADGAGWSWSIPLHDDTLSVGVVMHKDRFKQLRESCATVEHVYRHALERSPNIMGRLRHARQVEAVRTWKDYSYVAGEFAGPGYRLAGDAACFIDPLLSTGVHMAFLGGLSAAASICAELREQVAPGRARLFHDRCVRAAYSRFVMIVASFYLQIQNRDRNVIGDIQGLSHDSFQLAFESLQPILSGSLDAPRRDREPAMTEQVLELMAKMLLGRFNYELDEMTSNLVTRAEDFSTDVGTSERFPIDGLFIRMQRGALGLAGVDPNPQPPNEEPKP